MKPFSQHRHSELAIDLYRGVAALLVLIAHTVGMTLEAIHGTDSAEYPFVARIANATLGHGVFWVWGFFVISGFCVHQSIERDRERGCFDIRRYALARLTRVYPLFIIGLILAVVVWGVTHRGTGAVFPLKEMLGTLALVQQFTGDFPGFDPAWSLGNEALYYVLWPLALGLFGWRPVHTALGASLASVVVTASIVVFSKTSFRGESTHWLVPAWCLSALFVPWLVGVILAAVWPTLKSAVSPRIAAICVVWMLLIYAAQALVYFTRGRALWPMLAAYAAAPGFALLVAGGHWLRLGDTVLWTTRAMWLGILSYPCYILHMPVLTLIEHGLMPWLPDAVRMNSVLHALILCLPTVGFSATVGIAMERRIMAWRSKVIKRSILCGTPVVVTGPKAV